MSETTETNSGWSAGIGGLIGAAVGENGILGGNKNAVTPDQLDARFNSLQGQISTDAVQAQIAGLKDAVVHGNAHINLALCGLGHSMTQGFASVNQTILLEGAKGRELALQEALSAERARTAALHNDAGHKATQVLLNQVINAGNP